MGAVYSLRHPGLRGAYFRVNQRPARAGDREERMAEPEWELLTVRGLGMTDESAAEFVGTFVIHRAGSSEPVEQVQIRVKRSVLEEMSGTIQRLLVRSTRYTR
jgi:hypothetical protein